MPGLVHEALRRLREGELAMEWKSQELSRLRRELREQQQRLTLLYVGSAAMLAGVLDALWRWTPSRLLGGVLIVAGVVLLAKALLPSDKTA